MQTLAGRTGLWRCAQHPSEPATDARQLFRGAGVRDVHGTAEQTCGGPLRPRAPRGRGDNRNLPPQRPCTAPSCGRGTSRVVARRSGQCAVACSVYSRSAIHRSVSCVRPRPRGAGRAGSGGRARRRCARRRRGGRGGSPTRARRRRGRIGPRRGVRRGPGGALRRSPMAATRTEQRPSKYRQSAPGEARPGGLRPAATVCRVQPGTRVNCRDPQASRTTSRPRSPRTSKVEEPADGQAEHGACLLRIQVEVAAQCVPVRPDACREEGVHELCAGWFG